MKRDFREEYNNYIESDMPDLWSRIEPNLKEKVPVSQEEIAGTAENEIKPVENVTDIKKKKQNRAKIYGFVKIATPVAAGICLLVIGVGVMGISQKSMEESATADYECTEEAVAEESYDYTEESAEVEESFDYAENSAAPEESYEEEAAAEAPAEDYDSAQEESVTNNSMVQSDSVTGESANEEMLRGEEKEIAGAVLIRIAKASQREKEAGFAYIYVFRLEAGSDLDIYVTEELCNEWEENDGKLQRQKNYLLTLENISDTMKQEGDFSAEYILKEAVLLP